MHWTFTTRAQAETFAYLLSLITGDQTRISDYCRDHFRVQRFTGTRWVNA